MKTKGIRAKFKDFIEKNSKIIILVNMVLVLISVITIYSLYLKDYFDQLECALYDLRFRLSSELNLLKSADNDIVLLLFTEHMLTILNKESQFEISKWPIDRANWAYVNDYLIKSNAQLIIYDLQFRGDTTEASDELLARSLSQTKNSILACFATMYDINNQDYDPEFSRIQSQYPDLTLLKIVDQLLLKYNENIQLQPIAPYLSQIKYSQKDENNKILAYSVSNSVNLPDQKFLQQTNAIGFANAAKPQNDYVVRKMPIFSRLYDNNVVLNLSFQAALKLLPPLKTALSFKNNALYVGKTKINTDNHGQVLINWRQKDTYQNEDFYIPLIAEKYFSLDPENGFKILPEEVNYFLQPEYQYIFNNASGKIPETKTNLELAWLPELALSIEAVDLTAKTVIIGNATLGGDLHITSLGQMAGSEVIANTLDNYLNGMDFMKQTPWWVNLILYFLLIIISLAIIKYFDSYLYIFIGFIILITFYTLINLLIFCHFFVWIPLLTPLLIIFTSLLFGMNVQNLLTRQDLHKTYKLATTDGLTGLYNHRYFQEKMVNKIETAKRKEDSFSLLLIDIDFFKKFNDTYGHRAGDAVLIQVSRILQKNVRKNDIVFRYGGEEMCVILDQTKTDEALNIAHKLVEAVASTDFLIDEEAKNKTVRVTISAGVSSFPEHGQSVQGLIEFADQGLYRAKKGGRNRVGSFEDVHEGASASQSDPTKEIEIVRAKVEKQFEKLIQICDTNNLDFNDLVDQMIARSKSSLDQQASDDKGSENS